MSVKLTEQEFAELLSHRFEENIADSWGELILDQGLWSEAMNLAVSTRKGQVPFRAAYALEKAFLERPLDFAPYHERFIGDFSRATHPSVWRHYGKIMGILLKKKRLNLTDEQAEQVAETAVMRLVDEDIKVAVRVWSLDILNELKGRVEWVDRELPEIIENLKDAPSPGMISRLKKFGWIRK